MNFEIHLSSSSSSSSNVNHNYGNDCDASSSSSSSISFQHDHDVLNGNGNSAHDADHIYQIRTALHFAIGKLCRAEERADSLCDSSVTASNDTATATAFTLNVHTPARSNAANPATDDDVGDAATAKPKEHPIMSQEALTALTDLTFHYATTLLANDLVSFCHHAHRKTVKVEDVLLAVRKDGDGIGADLRRFLRQKGISTSDCNNHDHHVRQGKSGHPQNRGGDSATMDWRRHRSLLAMNHDNGSGSDGDSNCSSNSDGSVEELIRLTPERRRRLRLKGQRELQQRQTLSPKPTASKSGKEKSTTSTAKSNSKASGMKAKGRFSTSKKSQYCRRRNRRSGGEYCSSRSGSSSSSSSDDMEFHVDWTTTKTTAGGDTSSSAKGKNKYEKRRLFLDDSSDDDNDDKKGNDVDDHDHESMVVKDAGYGKHTDDNISPKFGNESNHGHETNKDDSNSDNDVLLAHRSSSNSRRKKPKYNNDATRKKMMSSSHDNKNSVCTAKQSKATSVSTNMGLSKKRKSATNTTSRRHSTDGGDLIDTDDDDDVDNLDVENGRKGKRFLDANGNDGDNANSIKLNAIVSTLKRGSFSANSASDSFAVDEDMVIDLADDDD